MPKLFKNKIFRTTLSVVIVVIVGVAIFMSPLIYFGWSKQYCSDYAQQNAKIPGDSYDTAGLREMEATGLNDKCMNERGFGG
jgi:hypothetical protein